MHYGMILCIQQALKYRAGFVHHYHTYTYYVVHAMLYTFLYQFLTCTSTPVHTCTTPLSCNNKILWIFLENSGISGKSGNFRKIWEFRKIPEKISGISGKTFFGNFRNYKKFGQLFGKFRCFYKNRSAQQCTYSKN